MARLILTWVGAIASALFCAGCTGQSVEGLWLGPYPTADSKDCQIRLKPDRGFSVTCKDTHVMSVGRYSWDGKYLKLETQMASINKDLLHEKPPIEFRVEGRGNTLELNKAGINYEWKRWAK